MECNLDGEENDETCDGIDHRVERQCVRHARDQLSEGGGKLPRPCVRARWFGRADRVCELVRKFQRHPHQPRELPLVQEVGWQQLCIDGTR